MIDEQKSLSRVLAARSRRMLAEADCPHWDYHSNGEADLPCCRELAAADEAYKNAIRFFNRKESCE